MNPNQTENVFVVDEEGTIRQSYGIPNVSLIRNVTTRSHLG